MKISPAIPGSTQDPAHPVDSMVSDNCLPTTLKLRLTKFSRPPQLEFGYPPQVPKDMFPGPVDQTWATGASALRTESLSNGPLLLHVSFLLAALERIRSGGSGLDGVELYNTITDELTALEEWRMIEWVRQQRSVPDPGALGRKTYFTGPSLL